MDLVVHLETFVAVADEMSFSRAADELGIAQPLLSRRIKTLETHVGGDLFDRSRRQIHITDLGVVLLPHAKDVLARAEHLLSVVRAAGRSTVVTLGVPPDCDPRSLARVIRSGTDRGLALGVHELPAAQRATALADGSLAVALVRVPPTSASLQVRLGLASDRPLTDGAGERPVHLQDLRPRRGRRGTSRSLLLTHEDDIPLMTEALHKKAARAGLSEDRLRGTSSTAAALAETLAGDGLLLCTEDFARRHQVSWAPLADRSIRRGYDLADGAARRAGTFAETLRDWLMPLLAGAVDAGRDRREDTRRPDDPDPLLAARG